MNAVVNHVLHQVRVIAPVEHVFEFACRMDRQREWNPYMEYWHLSGPLDQVGTTFDCVLDLVGQSTSFKGSVVEASRKRLIHLRLITDKGAADWRYRFESAGDVTLFTIEVEYEREGVFAGLTDRFVFHGGLDRAVGDMAERFAQLAAESAPVHA